MAKSDCCPESCICLGCKSIMAKDCPIPCNPNDWCGAEVSKCTAFEPCQVKEGEDEKYT